MLKILLTFYIEKKIVGVLIFTNINSRKLKHGIHTIALR